MESIVEKLFLQVLNMSLTASYVVLFVIALRFFLKKTPKIYSYALWSIVLFRLMIPISISSVYSLLKPFITAQGDLTYIPMNLGVMDKPQIDIGINSITQTINSSLPVATPIASVNPVQVWLLMLSAVWLLGVLGWITYSISSYVRMKHKIVTAIKIKDNIYECADINTPFILGVIKPCIYLPHTLNEDERSYILKHEQIHIKRLDNIIKPIAYFACCIHWFNPLVWISFKLMSRDMEMSCDEQVVNELGKEIKKSYSQSLLSLSVLNGGGIISPLAFGESNTKIRIKNLLHYKKPKIWVSTLLIIIVGSIGFGLLCNPRDERQDLSFLNPNNWLATISEKDKITVRHHGGTTYLNSYELMSWIEETNWKEMYIKSPYELSADYSVVVNEELKQRIELYESEKELVKVVYEGKWRYYSIQKDDYEELWFKIMTKSYFEPEAVIPVKDDDELTLQEAIVPSIHNEINQDLNIVSSYSPDKRFYIETYGVETNITAAGLYPAKGIRLIDSSTKNGLWEMTPGYYNTKFNWSSGSRFVAIYYEARTYGESIVLDTEGMNIIELPKIADLQKISKKNLAEQESRSDPYFIINKWLNEEMIQVDFKWTGENDISYRGSFSYDVLKKEIRDLQFND